MSSTAIQSACRLCARSMLFYPDTPQLECSACFTLNSHPQPELLAAPGEKPAKAPNALLLKAHTYRTGCYFDKAEQLYTSFITSNPDSEDLHEAHWGLAMCRFGVEHVEDSVTHKILPTCHFLSSDSLRDDIDYRTAVELAPADICEKYEEQGKYIDEAQQKIRELSRTMPAFDIFLCYKHSDPDHPGKTTEDYARAQHLYFALKDLGYNVFFANITLKKHAGSDYEAMIFHALNTSRAMLLFCSSPEYLDTAWVRSEWSRYLRFCKKDPDKKIISLMYGMKPSELPAAIPHGSIQALDMKDAFAFTDLTDSLDNIFGGVDKLLAGARTALEEGNWAAAGTYLSNAQDKISPASKPREYSTLCLYRLLVSLHLNTPEALKTCDKPFAESEDWQNAWKYATPEQRIQLQTLLPSDDTLADLALRAAKAALAVGHWAEASSKLASAAAHIDAHSQPDRQSDLCLCQLLTDLHLTSPEELKNYNHTFIGKVEWHLTWESANEVQRKYLQTLLSPAISRALQAAAKALASKCWKDAEKELDLISHAINKEQQNDDYAWLHVYRLMCSYQLSHASEFSHCGKPVETTPEWKTAMNCASPALRETLEKYLIDLPLLLNKLGLSATFNDEHTEATLNACCTHDAAITSLTLPEGVVAITADAFCDCINLRHIRLPRSLKHIDHGVIDCSKPGFVVELYDNTPLEDNPFVSPTTNSIRLLPSGAPTLFIQDDLLLQKTGDGTLAVVASMSQKTKLIVPNGVTVIRTNAFSTLAAKSSPSIVLPSSVTSIENGAFAGNPHLKTIQLGDQLTTIGASAFAGCTGLLEIRLPATVREMGGSVFSGCSAMTSAALSPSLVQISPFTFHGCAALTHVEIPDQVPAISDSAFKGCTALTRLRLPAALQSLGRAAFNGCVNLTEITIPQGVTLLPDSLFMGCKSLAKVEFSGVIETVASNVFSGCVSLQKLSFPQGLLAIGDAALQNCTMLRRLTLPQSVHTFGTGILNGTNRADISIICPRNSPAAAWGEHEVPGVNPGGFNAAGEIFGRLVLLPLRTLLHLLIILVPLCIIGVILQDAGPFGMMKRNLQLTGDFGTALTRTFTQLRDGYVDIISQPGNSISYILTIAATVVVAILLLVYLFYALRFVFWRKKKKPSPFAAHH